MKVAGFVLLALALLAVAGALLGRLCWQRRTSAIRAALDGPGAVSGRVALDALHGLPEPVQRYLRLALRDGQPIITRVRLRHSGRFDMGRESPRWRRFTSDQLVVPRPVGFDWNGRIAMFPGLAARVHDAYLDGQGLLVASIAGAIPVARLGGPETPDVIQASLDQGELLRFLAEAVWFPTALLPRDGLSWQAVDGRSAIARLHDGGAVAELLFRFADDGFVESVRSEVRGRYLDGEMIPTPWQGRFWNVEERGGMRIPIDGEVAWLLPEGPRPYWRGTIERIEFEFAEEGR